MAYNILSGNVSDTDLILTGAFSGAYVGDFDGDGFDLSNVTYIRPHNGSQYRIPFFGVQRNGDFSLTGSSHFEFNLGTRELNVNGTINANKFNIDVINKNVINMDVSGSTKFGDTADDTHEYTGSVLINGPLVVNGGSVVMNRTVVSATTFNAASSSHFIAVQTTTIGGASTINLPAASTLRDGQSFVIKDEQGAANSNNINIVANGTDEIDGENSVVIESPFGAINLYTNGSNKFFIY